MEVTDAQRFFDNTYARLVEQGGPSTCPATGACKYRSATGRRCAIGVNMTDAQYVPTMEGQGASAKVILDLFPSLDCEFLVNMQIAHDDAAADARSLARAQDLGLASPEADAIWMELWKPRMARLADQYKLQRPTNLLNY